MTTSALAIAEQPHRFPLLGMMGAFSFWLATNHALQGKRGERLSNLHIGNPRWAKKAFDLLI